MTMGGSRNTSRTTMPCNVTAGVVDGGVGVVDVTLYRHGRGHKQAAAGSNSRQGNKRVKCWGLGGG